MTPEKFTADRLKTMTISEIASAILVDWTKVSPYATPYLRAMLCLDNMDDYYGADSASNIVTYGLGNMTAWNKRSSSTYKNKGIDYPKLVKAELKSRLPWNRK